MRAIFLKSKLLIPKTVRFLSAVSLLFIICRVSLFGAYDSAYVNINFNKDQYTEVSPYLFGNFIEYYMCFQNGYPGMWAQELINRGFDIQNDQYGISKFWTPWYSSPTVLVEWEVPKGGYNTNALYYQRIIKPDQFGETGICQKFYSNDNQGYDFYIYMRGDSTIKDVKLKILDTTGTQVIFETTLSNPDSDWKKYSATIPQFSSYNQVYVMVSFSGTGVLDLDEASIMPSNNINGIRSDYYKMFAEWKPTILRYPGGWFVEYSGYRWGMAVGEIDKRAVYKNYEIVRMDFGIDEFLNFCEELKIEPHLTVNFLEGTPEESAALVEYCNGSIETKYGSLRAKNGHLLPYNVKIWEIGNEIWTEPENYAKGFVKFRDKMKEVDPTITCIISADIWQGRKFFDTLVDIVGNKCDIYGWHWAQPYTTKLPVTDEEVYLSAVGGSLYTERLIDSVTKWINVKGLSNSMTQAITEIWSVYNRDGFEWVYDTTKRGGSLENGLWMASQFNVVLRNSTKIKIMEKTSSVATYRTEIDYSTGRLINYTTPSYLACKMVTNHVGTKNLSSIVFCKNYSLPPIDDLFYFNDVPWIDVAVTKSDDSLFINILNRHQIDTFNISFNFEKNCYGLNAKIYEMYSSSYLDANTKENPEKIGITEKDWIVSDKLMALPHSFSIVAIPYKSDSYVDSNANGYSVFPNPFQEIFILQYPTDNKIISIKIYDIQGSEISNTIFDITKNPIDFHTDNLKQGVYLMRIVSNNGEKNIPLIKLTK